jgi:hypothetical protein
MTAKPTDDTVTEERRKPVCLLAPEWTEHARFEEDADICDDGRQGVACGSRKDDPPCPIADAASVSS